MNIIQSSLFNQTCTGRECFCRNRQGVGLHRAKNIDKHSQGNVCICLWLFVPLFHSYGDVTIAGEGLHFFFTLARHSWPLSSEDSLACHIYFDTGHPFISGVVDTCFYDFCRGWDSNTQPSAWDANALTHCATAVVTRE